jgi:glucosamine--fructose-6-phosphate aminotransferase (isomerizing)
VRVLDRDGKCVERAVRDQRAFGGCRREGPVQALHAEGDPRAAAAVANTLQERVANGRLLEAAFGPRPRRSSRTEHVHIVACGTSYHAGVVARYFIEQICKIPCSRRDRQRVPLPQRGGAEELAVRDHLAVR